MAAKKSPPAAANDAEESVSFEIAMKRLSIIVEELETGELSLEDSLARFEEGVRLARTSQAKLDAAEARVEELLRIDDRGAAVTEEFDE